jgi:glycine cleavage system aminomethyltransferase T
VRTKPPSLRVLSTMGIVLYCTLLFSEAGCGKSAIGQNPTALMRIRTCSRARGRFAICGQHVFRAGRQVTLGGFRPSLNVPVAMGYLPSSHAANGSTVFAEVRGQRLQVAAMPFVPNNYKR